MVSNAVCPCILMLHRILVWMVTNISAKGWTKMTNFADLDAMDDEDWDKVISHCPLTVFLWTHRTASAGTSMSRAASTFSRLFCLPSMRILRVVRSLSLRQQRYVERLGTSHVSSGII